VAPNRKRTSAKIEHNYEELLESGGRGNTEIE